MVEEIVEEWREIAEFPGYRVSDRGRVQTSLLRKYSSDWHGVRYFPSDNWTDITLATDRYGYFRACLSASGKRRLVQVHRLVCNAFNGPSAEGQQARHLDGNKHNNTPLNLKWGTLQENADDRKRHGTSRINVGSLNHNAKLTEEDIPYVRKFLADGWESRFVERLFGVSRTVVTDIKRGRSWVHV